MVVKHRFMKIELTRRENDPYDGGWRAYTPIILDIDTKLSTEEKADLIVKSIEELWSVQRRDLDMDYLTLFFMFNHTYSQILCDERKIKNDSGVWLDLKDYIWIRKIAD